MALPTSRPQPLYPDPAPLPLRDEPRLAGGTLYSLFAVGGLLGHRTRPVAWLCRYLDALIAHEGFPKPLPLPVRGGGTSRAAHRDSRWPSLAVDAWLARQTPPALVTAAETSGLAAASARLDARARGLSVIDGGRA